MKADDSGSEVKEVYAWLCGDGEMENSLRGPRSSSDEGNGRRLGAALLSDDSEPLFGEELSSCVGTGDVLV